MAKEWILNIATNRWGLNKKNSVGPVSEWIREANPKNKEEWERKYYDKLEQFLREKDIPLTPQEYLQTLGKKLYIKITEVLQAEIEEINEKDCIDYIHNLLIDRTYDGYTTEIETIYKKLRKMLNVDIHPACDEWDRLYNIDFYIEINGKYIGIQIKPITYNQTPQLHKWIKWLTKTHKDFSNKFKGKVFIVFSIKRDGKKEIYNREVVEEIKKEIERLKGVEDA